MNALLGATLAAIDQHLGPSHESKAHAAAVCEVECDDSFLAREIARHVDSDVLLSTFSNAADCPDELQRLIDTGPSGTPLIRTLIAVQGVARSLRNAIEAEAGRRAGGRHARHDA